MFVVYGQCCELGLMAMRIWQHHSLLRAYSYKVVSDWTTTKKRLAFSHLLWLSRVRIEPLTQQFHSLSNIHYVFYIHSQRFFNFIIILQSGLLVVLLISN